MNQTNNRKDLVEGTQGVIAGFSGPQGPEGVAKVLLTVTIQVPGTGPQVVTLPAAPRNLMLTKEYILQRAGSSALDDPQKETGTPDNKRKAPPSWILEDMDPDRVKIEKGWGKLLGDNDNLIKTFWLRGRIAVCLQALFETLPTYSDKDLVVCHRQNDKGGWRSELWTARPFAAEELVFVPHASQLKESHLTDQKNAVVGIPKYGPGKHPEDSSLALDGRTRTSLAHAGSYDDNEHTGSLYWLVSRTSAIAKANMSLENVSQEQTVKLSLPLKSKKRSVEWSSSDLPTIPILVNKKKIEAHVRLAMFHDEEKEKKDKKIKDEKAKEEKAKEEQVKEEKAQEVKAKEEQTKALEAKKEKAKEGKAKEKAKEEQTKALEAKAGKAKAKKDEKEKKDEAKEEKAKEKGKPKTKAKAKPVVQAEAAEAAEAQD